MIQTIIERYKKVNSFYENLIDVTEKKFSYIKINNKSKALEIGREEAKLIQEVADALDLLGKSIVVSCKEKGIEGNNIQQLVPFMNSLEKEEIMACQREAIHLARKLKNNQKMNICLVQAFMEAEKEVVDTMLHVVQEEKMGKSIFLNQEY